MAEEAQQVETSAPPSRYPQFKHAHTVVAHFRAHEVKNLSREDKENEQIALDYVARGIFVPRTLAIQMMVWDRTPRPSIQLHQDDKDCVAMIEAYMEYHGAASKLRQFFMELDLFPEIDTDYRLAKMVLKEVDERKMGMNKLECFVQAVLNVFKRRDMGDPRIDGSIKMRYICISIYTLLTPLLPVTTIQTMRLILGDGGFLLRFSLSSSELRECAISWGKYMRMQIYRCIVGLENLDIDTAQEQGDEVLEALIEVVKGEVRKRGELHKVVWNLHWKMEKVVTFWECVGEGLEVRSEEFNGPVREASTSWFVKLKETEDASGA